MRVHRSSATAVVATLAVLGFARFPQTANAGMVTAAYYHLGEADPGAAAGVTGKNPTIDSSGNGLDLTALLSSTYSSNVAATAAANTGSTLSMQIGGPVYDPDTDTYTLAGYGSGTFNWTTNTMNFCLEGWFKTSYPATQQALAFNGNSYMDGYGLYLINGTVQGIYGGIGNFDTTFVPTANEWFYAALVNVGGTTSVYVNSTTPMVVDATLTPNTTESTMAMIGMAGYWSSPQDPLLGSADEVRMSTFNGVTQVFDANTDLLIAVPEPSHMVFVAGIGAVLGAWQMRRGKRGKRKR